MPSSSRASPPHLGVVSRDDFYRELEKILVNKRHDNSSYIRREEYDALLRQVLAVKNGTAAAPAAAAAEPLATPALKKQQQRRLSRYSVCGTRLCATRRSKEGRTLYYLCVDELYDVIHTIHIAGHLGRNRMMYEANKNYKNLTCESIVVYLKMCRACVEKKIHTKKRSVVKPILEKEFNDRCQVDLVDMQSCPDEKQSKFIFVYQDHFTKFVQLRALRTKRAEEVAEALAGVFYIFGAPCILQSDNGREFVNGVIDALVKQWPHARIVHGAPRHSQSQGSVERANRDIKLMLATWCNDHPSESWSAGLPAVQFNYNAALHASIGQSPYECLFGVPVRRGITGLGLPPGALDGVRTEEELQQLVAAHEHSSSTQDEDDGRTQRISLRRRRKPARRNSTENDPDKDDDDDDDDDDKDDDDDYVDDNDNNDDDDDEDYGLPGPSKKKRRRLRSRLHSSRPDPGERRLAIKSNRTRARRHLEIQADSMLNRSSCNRPLVEGDLVRIYVPDVDRGPLDSRNLLGCVLKVRNDVVDERDGGVVAAGSSTSGSSGRIKSQMVQVATQHGVIDRLFPTNELEPVDYAFFSMDTVPFEKTLSLRAAARAESRFGGQGVKRCFCKAGGCRTNQCGCRYAEILCTDRCHRDGTCANRTPKKGQKSKKTTKKKAK